MILRNEGEIQNSLELFQACHMLNPSNPDNLKEVARNLYVFDLSLFRSVCVDGLSIRLIIIRLLVELS